MINIKGCHPTRQMALIGGTHAREWIGDAVVLWTLGCITELYDKDKNLTQVLDSLDLYICPCYNPDGYTYSRTVDRLWRKNRRVNGDGTFGVDQNRNWDVDWGNGCPNDTSSLVYCGPGAFSEPEPRAMNDFLRSLPNLSSIIDFHSPQKRIVRPYSYINETCPDETLLFNIGYRFVVDYYSVHGTKLENARGCDLYVLSGGCTDYNYISGVKNVFILELLGDNFALPESEIQKQGEEAFAGIRYLLERALK